MNTANDVILDDVVTTKRIIDKGVFIGTISFSFINKNDCHILGFNCEHLILVKYRHVVFDFVRSTGRKTIHYSRYKNGVEFNRVRKL